MYIEDVVCVCACVCAPKVNVNFWHYAKNFPRENADWNGSGRADSANKKSETFTRDGSSLYRAIFWDYYLYVCVCAGSFPPTNTRLHQCRRHRVCGVLSHIRIQTHTLFWFGSVHPMPNRQNKMKYFPRLKRTGKNIFVQTINRLTAFKYISLSSCIVSCMLMPLPLLLRCDSQFRSIIFRFSAKRRNENDPGKSRITETEAKTATATQHFHVIFICNPWIWTLSLPFYGCKWIWMKSSITHIRKATKAA